MSAGKTESWEREPGELAEQAYLVRPFTDDDCKVQAELFALNGDPVHLWRAWRSARACGAVSPAALECLSVALDGMAATQLQARNPKRATQREIRNWILVDYYHEQRRRLQSRPGCAKSTDAIYRDLETRYQTTAGRVEQLVLQHEGRDGRG